MAKIKMEEEMADFSEGDVYLFIFIGAAIIFGRRQK